ncbi:MAG: serine hydrolase, partial [Candidatus Eremiobacteraeota bacterium]|nr:serine hydrolase [Candidatus Eremiobacteraeota bacterium]
MDIRQNRELDRRVEEALSKAGLKDMASAYLIDLSSLACGGWRPDEVIYPASVIKVPIMAEAFHQYDQGVLDPGARIVVSEANQTTTAETTPLTAGYEATIEEMVDLMVTRSDNIATNQLMDVLRRERVTEYMRTLGLGSFLLGRKLSGSEPLIADPEMIGRNRLSALEIGRLLALIAI